MLRDLLRGDVQGRAVARVVAGAAPDVLVLQGVDFDHDLHGLRALRDVITEAGLHYSHLFALRPNSGMASGHDLDGNGRLGEAADAQGYGKFAGEGGLAILSRHPVREGGVVDFSAMLWRDLPGARLPVSVAGPFPSQGAQAVQRLSSVGHWAVPVAVPGGEVTILAFHATTPVFDGPEDRNGLRNADELRFWLRYLDGALNVPPPGGRFVVMGVANNDPRRGEGRKGAIRALVTDPRLQDPLAGRDTVDWPPPGPGRRRADVILPSADWRVMGAGVVWPAPGEALHDAAGAASRHRLIWVDLDG
ncbi:Endonuclease/Exonuclease/phosphatase family protein [Salinihabitans flavidus]|uniref:Endonuclease/Exonuclease/phosphatase family protein n=1 Tax=Salinihabitans flavidus TaxID=569882 RepID=A0A1H8MWJ2_9RHOB|nr:Endonuclease/Exonuclease/phosphatase family protein [Salinihabitans flavidus]